MEFEVIFLRSCCEQISKVNRIMERGVEKETNNTTTTLAKLREKKATEEQIRTVSSKLLASLQKFRQEIVQINETHQRLLNSLLSRIETLKQQQLIQQLDNIELSEAQKELFRQKRVDRFIIDFLLREGLYETAKHLSQESDIEMSVEIEIFSTAEKIENDFNKKSCELALSWCNENKIKLKKLKSDFEIRLRIQEFSRMICESKPDFNPQNAIQYANKHFSPIFSLNSTFTSFDGTQLTIDNIKNDIIQVCSLLAFYKNNSSHIFKKYSNEESWKSLKDQFRYWNLLINSVPSDPLLCISLHSGAILLKSSECYSSQNRSQKCPICFEPISEITKDLPSAQQRTHLICRISGEKMDEDNPPIALPNGYVYSKNALDEMAVQNDGIIVCPVTNATFRVSQLKKVFIT